MPTKATDYLLADFPG